VPRRRAGPDWGFWLRRWEEQQDAFNPDRERRFETMFDTLEAAGLRRFVALDLGSGPGSLSARLLRRFPAARCVAVDFDPVVLRVGREALASFGGRLRWVDVDLGRPGWWRSLPVRRFDAALTTTALHWLRTNELGSLYRDLRRVLRPGAVVLNGDYLPWGPRRRRLGRLGEEVLRVRFGGRTLQAEWGGWNRWWKDIAREPGLRAEFRERSERFSGAADHPPEVPSLEAHTRALRRAGFREAEVVWQDYENRVLLAVR
jgi:SAM-dependent methyltransferase